jgi:DNA repair photolyase
MRTSSPDAPALDTARPALSVREVRCSTLLHRLEFTSYAGYTANLYRGCTHGCTYCYAPSLIHDERRWGKYVDVKVNAPEVMERELMKLKREEVFLSSASDPYQPVEGRYGITRKCLKILIEHRFPVSVLTRSPLVLRDLDLLRAADWARVGMSLTTVPDRRFEPGVPALARRVETLRKLGKAGIQTWVSLAPVIPGIVMVDLERLLEELACAGVSHVSLGVLRFSGYDESRKMFEQSAGMSYKEALVGRDEIVARLSALVRRLGMEPKDASESWREEPDGGPLDAFLGREEAPSQAFASTPRGRPHPGAAE